MIEEINSWLNSNQDYYQGVSIYNQYGNSPNQKRMFQNGGPTRRNNELLLYELKKLAKSSPIVQQIIRPSIKSEIKPVIIPKVEFTGTRVVTTDAAELKNQIIIKLKDRDQKHSVLELLPTDEIRRQYAFQILDLSDEIGEMYERLQHFEKHGVLPEKKKSVNKYPVNEMDTGKLLLRRGTLRTYISRYDRLVKESKNPERRVINQQKLDQYNAELEQIENKLKN